MITLACFSIFLLIVEKYPSFIPIQLYFIPNYLFMKFMNKIDKTVSGNDSDAAQLYKHGDVHVMVDFS